MDGPALGSTITGDPIVSLVNDFALSIFCRDPQGDGRMDLRVLFNPYR